MKRCVCECVCSVVHAQDDVDVLNDILVTSHVLAAMQGEMV